MNKGQSFAGQFQHRSRHVVQGSHLAVFHHLTNAVDAGRGWVDSGPGLNQVAAQAEAHQTCGEVHIQHTGSQLEEGQEIYLSLTPKSTSQAVSSISVRTTSLTSVPSV